MRPALEKLANARAEAIEFLAKNPDSELRNWLSVLVRATAPPTKEEALPVMVENANKEGGWQTHSYDLTRARDAISEKIMGNWQDSIRAQWATLTHFMGGDDAA